MSNRVFSEWDRLSEAVVGTADFGDSLLQRFQPQVWKAIHDELDGLAARLEAGKVKVHRLPQPPTRRVRSGTDNVFVRDSAIIMGDRVLETELHDPDRRQERIALRPVLETFAGRTHGWYLPMDRADREQPDAEALYLEGGDVLVCGRDVLVGLSGGATSAGGLAWLEAQLPETHRLHRVPLIPAFWHLDLALMPVRPGLAIWYPGAFPEGLPRCLDGWELIALSREEARGFGANGLMLSPDTCLLADGHQRLAGELGKHGIVAELLPFSSVCKRNGGLRCATLALHRG